MPLLSLGMLGGLMKHCAESARKPEQERVGMSWNKKHVELKAANLWEYCTSRLIADEDYQTDFGPAYQGFGSPFPKRFYHENCF